MDTPTLLLIIEDPVDLLVYAIYLCDKGYNTILAKSLGEGLRFLESDDVSMVIVSRGPGGLDGRTGLEQALQLYPKVPVLVLGQFSDLHFYLDGKELATVNLGTRPEPQDLACVIDTHTLHSGTA